MIQSVSRTIAAALAPCFGCSCFAEAAGGEKPIRIAANTHEIRQTLEGFGASDAWNVDFVGKYWDDEEKAEMARRLFSKDFDESGDPLGIGLSIWRFNIGAGSAEQGKASQISNPTRRVEGFLQPDGSYDWNRQSGQQWFLEEAHRYEVETLVAFTNSPPVSMTRNGIAHGSGGFRSNLRSSKRQEFANFLCDVLEHFESRGLPFDYLSPINEPQYAWKTSKQEGSPWTNREVFEMARALDATFSERRLPTKLLVPEAADWRNLFERKGQSYHSHQLAAFFSPKSSTYLGDLPSVGNRFAVHSYWTNGSEQEILRTRRESKQLAERFEVQLHQTEYSLIALDRIQNNKPQDAWEVAQFIAKIIHFDLTEADVASWSFWTALAEDRNGMNRYLLLELVPNTPGDLTSGGSHLASKNLAALGHYSRFIRPGYQRVETQSPPLLDDAGERSLLASAYLSPDKAEGVLVVSNLSNETIELELSWGQGETPSDSKVYLTNRNHDLKRLDEILSQGTLTLPPQSIATVVEQLQN
ncbi:glycoside hydrolase [Pelagicoccus sp. SDUM812005]|uniref:glycoside hydrolase n=1 Tax=Pelagicoccus sp. SDUM812005 TaxID=3041257 RepID=UPI00280CE39E|nr:glycoside hydrolase [Pelagicoccus sp. SDUM812005]MDQ8181614.1 glycoside hydrolase [Pelagicoccus sp. SDUM812005]